MSFLIAGTRLLLLGLLQLFGRKSRRDGKGMLSVTGETRRLRRAEVEEPLQGMGGVGDVGPRNTEERCGNSHRLET